MFQIISLTVLILLQKEEVVIMNSLTANIHFTLASFYNPTPQRFKILTHASSFPSDTVRSKFDPKKILNLVSTQNDIFLGADGTPKSRRPPRLRPRHRDNPRGWF